MKVVVFSQIARVQWSNTVGSTLWGMASGVAVVMEIVAVGCNVFQMWRDGAPWALQVRVLCAPAVTGHVAIPDPPGRSAGVCTKEVRESHGDPGPLEGGGLGLRLLVLSVPP